MQLTRTYEINGRILKVFDDFMSVEASHSLSSFLESVPHTQSEFDTTRTSTIRQWIAEIDVLALQTHSLLDELKRCIAASFPSMQLEPYRAYCNNIAYGDVLFAHRDCDSTSDDVTALIYPCKVWSHDWAGETVFFDNLCDAVAVVAPRPGRLALFAGAILHSARAPSRTCTQSRLSLAIKFRGSSATSLLVKPGIVLPEFGPGSVSMAGRWSIAANTPFGAFEHEMVVDESGNGIYISDERTSPVSRLMTSQDAVFFESRVYALGTSYLLNFKIVAADPETFEGDCFLAGTLVGHVTLSRLS